LSRELVYTAFHKGSIVAVAAGGSLSPRASVGAVVDAGSVRVSLDSPDDLRQHALHCLAAAEVLEQAFSEEGAR
jgi:hypothetical protein